MTSSHGRFVWYELLTTNVAAAEAFYADVIGWRVQDVSAPGMAYALFIAGQASVCGIMGMPEEARRSGAKPRWMGYVAVDDVDAAAARTRELGGSVRVPPTDIPGISRFSIVADPQTATFALFKGMQTAQERPVEPGAPGHVGWHELLATDLEKAVAFYRDLFGWREVDADIDPTDPYQLFSVGGQTIGGMFTKPAMVPVPFWLFYFNVRDIDAAAERVTASGGAVLEGPSEGPDGNWVVRCADPQGAIFALEGRRSQDRRFFVRDPVRNPNVLSGRWHWWIKHE